MEKDLEKVFATYRNVSLLPVPFQFLSHDDFYPSGNQPSFIGSSNHALPRRFPFAYVGRRFSDPYQGRVCPRQGSREGGRPEERVPPLFRSLAPRPRSLALLPSAFVDLVTKVERRLKRILAPSGWPSLVPAGSVSAETRKVSPRFDRFPIDKKKKKRYRKRWRGCVAVEGRRR